jgi:hypothetical protein
MAKRRGRTISLDSLVATLSELDKQRKVITDQLRAAVRSVMSGVPSPFSVGTGRKRGRPAGSKTVKTKGARKRRKMSAAARAKISAAQKKRWAKKKGDKK